MARPSSMILFLLGVLFVVYVLAGYPLLLDWRARRLAKPTLKQESRRTVSILIAVRNGDLWIREKLRSILALDYPKELVQIVVVSDGSSDATEAIVTEFVAQGVELIPIPPSGKPAALNKAMERATGEILFFTDVRQPLDPASLRNLVACFADPTVGVASGELVILAGRSRQEADVGLYWRYEKWMRRRLSQIDSVLGATGAIYAMRCELAVPLPKDTLLDDVYLPLAAFFRGYRVIWDDTAKAFDRPTALEPEFERKVRTQAGVWQLLRYYPALLKPSNRMWIDFVSHKLGRLLVPWALLAIAVSSFSVPYLLQPVAIAPQLLFYGLAALDLVVSEGSPIKRASSAARTFTVLMAAALCSVAILFLPSRSFWDRK